MRTRDPAGKPEHVINENLLPSKMNRAGLPAQTTAAGSKPKPATQTRPLQTQNQNVPHTQPKPKPTQERPLEVNSNFSQTNKPKPPQDRPVVLVCDITHTFLTLLGRTKKSPQTSWSSPNSNRPATKNRFEANSKTGGPKVHSPCSPDSKACGKKALDYSRF